MTTRMWLSLAVGAAIAGSAVPAAAQAPADPAAPSVAVRTSDLDLSRAADAKVLLGRLRQAASETCGGAPSLGDLPARAAYRACMAATMDNAVAGLHAPVVTALYQGAPPHAVALTGVAG